MLFTEFHKNMDSSNLPTGDTIGESASSDVSDVPAANANRDPHARARANNDRRARHHPNDDNYDHREPREGSCWYSIPHTNAHAYVSTVRIPCFPCCVLSGKKSIERLPSMSTLSMPPFLHSLILLLLFSMSQEMQVSQQRGHS